MMIYLTLNGVDSCRVGGGRGGTGSSSSLSTGLSGGVY